MFKKIMLVMTLFSIEQVGALNIGEATGKIYSTDIIAFVDGNAIESYNIGGKTVIVAEEMREYGFDVVWSAENRSLTISSLEMPQQFPEKTVERGELGSVVGDVFYTDINVYVNGIFITSYNIGGKTAVAIEELAQSYGEFHRERNYNFGLGYSNAGFKHIWLESERVVKLFSLRPNMNISTQYGNGEITGFYDSYTRGMLFNQEIDGEINVAGEEEDFISITAVFEAAGINYKNENGVLSISKNSDKKIILQKATNRLRYRNCHIPIIKLNMLCNETKIESGNTALILGKELYLEKDFLSTMLGISLEM